VNLAGAEKKRVVFVQLAERSNCPTAGDANAGYQIGYLAYLGLLKVI